MITISETAQEKIREIIETRRPDVKGLRLGYEGKSRYAMSLVDEIPDDGDDIVVPFQGFDLVIDPQSAAMMEGASIDYIETPTESGFKIDNPADNKPPTPRPDTPPMEGTDREIWERVEALLESDINPSVAAHGGVVSLIDVKEGVVYVEMGGGCQGCGMANVTLKQGIERLVRAEVPEVVEILDVTEHAEGRNPYYAAAAK
ncbi:MAG TPA: NifU family protein [Armatimonadota bacterium]|nr:NifU family protein [Armatimonadota bacterium]